MIPKRVGPGPTLGYFVGPAEGDHWTCGGPLFGTNLFGAHWGPIFFRPMWPYVAPKGVVWDPLDLQTSKETLTSQISLVQVGPH